MLPDHDEWDDGAAVEPQLGELLGRYVYGLDSVLAPSSSVGFSFLIVGSSHEVYTREESHSRQ
jgi:hypothetical protein